MCWLLVISDEAEGQLVRRTDLSLGVRAWTDKTAVTCRRRVPVARGRGPHVATTAARLINIPVTDAVVVSSGSTTCCCCRHCLPACLSSPSPPTPTRCGWRPREIETRQISLIIAADEHVRNPLFVFIRKDFNFCSVWALIQPWAKVTQTRKTSLVPCIYKGDGNTTRRSASHHCVRSG